MLFRSLIDNSSTVALGCSHTWGIGVEAEEAWPYLLGASNFGKPGCSADYVARILPEVLTRYNSKTVYVLWPDWTRFDYEVNGEFVTSLPQDKNRIFFMDTATDEFLKENYLKHVNTVHELCKGIDLVDISLYDLISFIDHADKWPLSLLGHHYNHVWHEWVADIFKENARSITNHRHFD
jgi:hypothetical protein